MSMRVQFDKPASSPSDKPFAEEFFKTHPEAFDIPYEVFNIKETLKRNAFMFECVPFWIHLYKSNPWLQILSPYMDSFMDGSEVGALFVEVSQATKEFSFFTDTEEERIWLKEKKIGSPVLYRAVDPLIQEAKLNLGARDGSSPTLESKSSRAKGKAH